MTNSSQGPLPSKISERQRLRHLASTISPAEHLALSNRIGAHVVAYLIKHIRPQDGAIAVYQAIHTEPDLRLAYSMLREAGFQLALPKVIAPRAALEFMPWSEGDALVANAWGIGEPQANKPILARHDLAAIVAPCVGYALGGFRIGYGGGYYDRTLQNLRSLRPNQAQSNPTLCVGVAFSICKTMIAESIKNATDQLFDEIVTELGLLA